jgi:membrane protease YdiL (CAAX protease family)
MPTALDIAFAVFFTVIITAFDTIYFVPKFKAEVNAGVPNARLHAYRRPCSGNGYRRRRDLALMRSGRPWSELGIVPPTDGRMIASAAIVALIVGVTVQQLRAIGRTTPERRLAIRPKLAFVEYLLPHSRDELRWFTALSVTAGVCEELLYRGFLFWVLKAYVGTALAALIGVILFGALHLYQGTRGAFKAGMAGLVMMIIVLLTGWLFPAMVVHALVDLGAGVLGFTVLAPSEGPALRPEA